MSAGRMNGWVHGQPSAQGVLFQQTFSKGQLGAGAVPGLWEGGAHGHGRPRPESLLARSSPCSQGDRQKKADEQNVGQACRMVAWGRGGPGPASQRLGLGRSADCSPCRRMATLEVLCTSPGNPGRPCLILRSIAQNPPSLPPSAPLPQLRALWSWVPSLPSWPGLPCVEPGRGAPPVPPGGACVEQSTGPESL